MDWKIFWDQFPLGFEETDFYRQVGKTFHGNPVSEEVLLTIVQDIEDKLIITSDDVVLDVCCGNGLISDQIAKKCKEMEAVDYSSILIQTAKKYHQRNNLSYYCASALEINGEMFRNKLFTRIYMYEALQHFTEEQFPILLDKLSALSSKHSLCLIGSVPDIEKIEQFYDTPEKLAEYYARKENDDLMLGTWWNKDYIRKTCSEKNLSCEILDIKAGLYTAHYRFDIIIYQ